MSRYLMIMVVLASAATNAHAAIYLDNGFETNTVDWSSQVTRVATGNNGIASASGSFHGQTTAGGFTRWNGYNFGAGSSPFQEYRTAVDIYLDVGATLNNDTRFDYTSAISNALGAHLRDFVFNAGFYNDSDATGTGPRFVISASNSTGRANSFPKNPGRDPFAITTTGWYTFEHHFIDNGGVLAVELSIFDDMNALLNQWVLSNPTDVIPGVAGGNRYGWFPNVEMPFLAIDNSFMETVEANGVVPEPASVAIWSLLSGVVGLGVYRRRNRAAL